MLSDTEAERDVRIAQMLLALRVPNVQLLVFGPGADGQSTEEQIETARLGNSDWTFAAEQSISAELCCALQRVSIEAGIWHEQWKGWHAAGVKIHVPQIMVLAARGELDAADSTGRSVMPRESAVVPAHASGGTLWPRDWLTKIRRYSPKQKTAKTLDDDPERTTRTPVYASSELDAVSSLPHRSFVVLHGDDD